MRARIGALVAALVMGGCVSGGNMFDGDCHISWLDDGAMMRATTGIATWASTTDKDSVDLVGVNPSAGVEIYAAVPTPFTAQTFVCGQTTSDQSLLLTYRNGDPAGPAISAESCSVTFTQIGAIGTTLTGTFEVVFDRPSGGTKSITNGTFELPLSK
jgi:hypothetical protein